MGAASHLFVAITVNARHQRRGVALAKQRRQLFGGEVKLLGEEAPVGTEGRGRGGSQPAIFNKRFIS
jgi:hypothetical protein